MPINLSARRSWFSFSIPHGTGSMAGNVIEFIVPYPQTAFKDRFEYFPESDTWTLEITAQQPFAPSL